MFCVVVHQSGPQLHPSNPIRYVSMERVGEKEMMPHELASLYAEQARMRETRGKDILAKGGRPEELKNDAEWKSISTLEGQYYGQWAASKIQSVAG